MAAFVRDIDVRKLLDSFLSSDSIITGRYEPSENDTREETIRYSKPRDKQRFLQRVHTFTSMTWCAKPAWLSPLVCARYGWENTGVDCLHCVSCDKYISGRIPPSTNPTVYEDCCRRVMGSLRTGHTTPCPWSNNPSPSHFLTVNLDTRVEALQLLNQGFSQLITMGGKLPIVSDTTLQLMKLSNDQLDEFLSLCPEFSDVDLSMKRSAAVLSLTGWTRCTKKSDPVVSCVICNRRVGLWNFLSFAKPDPEPEKTPEELTVASPSEYFSHVASPNSASMNQDQIVKTLFPQAMQVDQNTVPVEGNNKEDQNVVPVNGNNKENGGDDRHCECEDQSLLNEEGIKGKSMIEPVHTDGHTDITESESALEVFQRIEECQTNNDAKSEKLDGVVANSEQLQHVNNPDESVETISLKNEGTDDKIRNIEQTDASITEDKPDHIGQELGKESPDISSESDNLNLVLESPEKMDCKTLNSPKMEIQNMDENKETPSSHVKEDNEQDVNNSQDMETSKTKSPEPSTLILSDVKNEKEIGNPDTEKESIALESMPENESANDNPEEESSSTPKKELVNANRENVASREPIERLDGSQLLHLAGGDSDGDEDRAASSSSTPVKRKVEQDSSPRQKRSKIQPKIRTTPFHPLIEHHSWCPWVRGGEDLSCPSALASPERRPGSKQEPGWLHVCHLLLPQSHPCLNESFKLRGNKTTPEALRSIRRLFNEWVSPAASK